MELLAMTVAFILGIGALILVILGLIVALLSRIGIPRMEALWITLCALVLAVIVIVLFVM